MCRVAVRRQAAELNVIGRSDRRSGTSVTRPAARTTVAAFGSMSDRRVCRETGIEVVEGRLTSVTEWVMVVS
jgi:hypothetical protein